MLDRAHDENGARGWARGGDLSHCAQGYEKARLALFQRSVYCIQNQYPVIGGNDGKTIARGVPTWAWAAAVLAMSHKKRPPQSPSGRNPTRRGFFPTPPASTARRLAGVVFRSSRSLRSIQPSRKPSSSSRTSTAI